MPGTNFAKVVTLSFFDDMEGPKLLFSYPPDTLSHEIQSQISDAINNLDVEGFFTHSFATITSLDYFFELNSSWARGNKEMILLSTIFEEKVAPEIDYALRFLSVEFAASLKNAEESFKGFHSKDEKKYPKEESANIREMKAYILQNLELLFFATNETISEKIFEKQIGSLRHFTEEDASPIRWMIGEEGVKILIAVLRGASTREEITTQGNLSPELISNQMPILLSLDLAAEGREILLTNRGLKFLGFVGVDFDIQYNEFEKHSFHLIFNQELVQIINVVSRGATTPQEISSISGIPMADLKRRLPVAFNFNLLSGGPNLVLITPIGVKFQKYAESHDDLEHSLPDDPNRQLENMEFMQDAGKRREGKDMVSEEEEVQNSLWDDTEGPLKRFFATKKIPPSIQILFQNFNRRMRTELPEITLQVGKSNLTYNTPNNHIFARVNAQVKGIKINLKASPVRFPILKSTTNGYSFYHLRQSKDIDVIMPVLKAIFSD
jgi:hypothetical protein